jgi:hypothetical protein
VLLRQSAELCDVLLGALGMGDVLQVLSDHLAQALVHGMRHTTRLLNSLLID